ncbi:hypothetical protein QE152_g37441 [Popillia japonica]|uniref:Uncharacterized protein n=1 Tax=Popillia japonica TaxID=7064 RepID=A0AAW1IAC7_POPJA
MPLTQNQILDIKDLFKECVKDILVNKEFIDTVTNVVAKTIDEKIDNVLKKYCERCDELEKANKVLVNKIDNLEQYSRRNSIRIFGVAEKSNENIQDIVMNMCSEKLNIDFSLRDIDRAHRIGPRQVGNKKRSIILKLTSFRCKMEILKNRHKLKGTAISIAEDLTKTRYDLYKLAQRKFGVKNTFTLDGTVYIRDCGIKRRIGAIQDLEK